MISDVEQTQRPQTGEQTGGQQRGGGLMEVASFLSKLPSWGSAPPAGMSTWRKMRENPIVAIGRMAVHAPIKASQWSIEATDDAPSGAEDLIADHLLDRRPEFINDAIRALDFGNALFELVWEEDGGALVVDKFKPLRHEATKILQNKTTGRYEGLKQADVELAPENTLLIPFDADTGDLRGRPLLENIRAKAWWPWEQSLMREGQMTTKAAGTTLVVKYPPGEGEDQNGGKIDNFELAQKLIAALGRGEGVAMPKIYEQWAQDALARGVDPDKLLAWQMDFLEPGTGHVTELLEGMRQKERLILRGLMVPERSVTEGEYGTKADSESQSGFVLVFAEEVLNHIVRCVNRWVVDRMLVLNFPTRSDRVKVKGTVRIIAEPIVDEKRAMIRQMVKEIMSNPVNADLWATLTDVTSQLEMVGLPAREEREQDQLARELDRMRRQQGEGDA